MHSIHPPVLFHLLKHHLQWLRSFTEESARQGPDVMSTVATKLLTVGNSQMDVYTGVLSPTMIAQEIMQQLASWQIVDSSTYAAWLKSSGGYRVVLLQDQSKWVLRWGDIAAYYVHIHPARYSPDSVRVKASTLKTAVLVSIWNRLYPQVANELSEINLLRKKWLLLPPIQSLAEADGLRRVLEWLQ